MKQTFLDTRQKFVSLGAASVIGFIMRGITRVFGLLFVASLNRYGASRKITSVPFILPFAVNNIIGPLVGYLNSKWGLRVVIVLGCLLVSLSLALSYFAEDIVVIIVLVGLGFGFGFGFAINLIPQSLTYRFQSHIDKANGLYQGASAIGGFVILVITHYLLATYGLSGTFLILGGIALHGVPAAMLLFKPKPKKQLTSVVVSNVEKEAHKPLNDSSICENGKGEKEAHKTEADASVNGFKSVNKEANDKASNSPETQKFIQPSTNNTNTKKPPPASLFRVFLDPVFLFMNVTQSMGLFVFVCLWTVMVDASLDRGVTKEQGVQILLGAAITDTIGRTFLGIFTDAGYITRSNFATLCSGLMGVTLLCFVWSSGYVLIMVIMCLSTFLLGALMMIGIGILSMFVEKPNVRMATASRYFLYAPMSICQPYIIGYYRDTLNSYNGLFYTMAVVSFLSAFMYFITPALARIRDRAKERQSQCQTKT